ncbi:MAG: hypothetical protein J6C66_02125, partial [Prevotella sp.]|nr:hypothetical protein [Prevotella sp.]
MAIVKGKIGNALTSVAEDHVVAVSADVFDEAKGKYQSEINVRNEEAIAAEITRAKAAEEQLNARKADEDGYHPKMSVGFSDNLVGRGEAVDAQITFRPSGGAQSIEDGVARIERIKGNSIVWNQLAQVKGSQTESGVIIESDGTGSYTVGTEVDTPTTADIFFPITDTIVSGRKVLFFGAPSGASASTYCLKAQTAGTADVGSGAIVASTSTDEVIGLFIAAGTTINTAVKFTPQVFDLTMMFGAGYEPSTIEEFKALYPLAFYAYNTGELRSLSATAIKSVGFNALNLPMRKEYIPDKSYSQTSKHPFDETQCWNCIASNGYSYQQYRYDIVEIGDGYIAGSNDTTIGNGYGLGFPIRVLPNTKYHFEFTNVIGNTNIGYYTKDGVYLSREWNDNVKNFTTPKNCFWLLIVFKANGTTSISFKDITLNLRHTGYRDGEVEPYEAFERVVPIKEFFPDGMKSAGAAYDEINANKAIKRIGVIEDTSKLTWYTSSGIFYATVAGIAKNTRNYILPLSYIKNNPADNSTIINESDKLYIKDSSIT